MAWSIRNYTKTLDGAKYVCVTMREYYAYQLCS